ncbi:MAG: GGDEF domain-containing protein, partial [Lachnospiraceae bacterium]|nr:GGDEF domain-containing protein [Lachnospiraceae bacterium]
MQKTFIKYAVMIITSAIFLILFINFLFSRRTLETQQFNTFHAKIEQVIHTLESNRMELELVRKNLDEDYLIRAKAATYVMDRQAEVVTDVSMMQYLAELLNVDELHVIDENGIIVSSSVRQYVGFDMTIHEQTKPFLDLLESGDKEAYLIQEPQPNAAEGNIMQY